MRRPWGRAKILEAGSKRPARRSHDSRLAGTFDSKGRLAFPHRRSQCSPVESQMPHPEPWVIHLPALVPPNPVAGPKEGRGLSGITGARHQNALPFTPTLPPGDRGPDLWIAEICTSPMESGGRPREVVAGRAMIPPRGAEEGEAETGTRLQPYSPNVHLANACNFRLELTRGKGQDQVWKADHLVSRSERCQAAGVGRRGNARVGPGPWIGVEIGKQCFPRDSRRRK